MLLTYYSVAVFLHFLGSYRSIPPTPACRQVRALPGTYPGSQAPKTTVMWVPTEQGMHHYYIVF